MDRDTKRKLAVVAAVALVLALSVGAAGAIGVSRVLDGDEERSARAFQVFPDGRSFDVEPWDFYGPDFELDFDDDFPRPRLFGDLDSASSYLGMDEDELRDRLRDGETLAEIAEDEGKSVAGLVDALVEGAAERLDEAVEDGRLTREQAGELEQRLEQQIEDVVRGELPGFDRPFRFGEDPFFPGASD
jgi:hypothetical protein